MTQEAIALRPTTAGAMSLKPASLQDAMELSTLLAKSALVPIQFRGKPEDVFVAMNYGLEVGLSPLQALQSIAVINGRPTMWGDAVLGIVKASGLLEEFEEGYTKEGDKPEQVYGWCRLRRKGEKHAVESRFSWLDAQRAKLTEKDTYKQYPQRMLKLRARSWALRDAFPDVLRGIQIREEVEDYPPDKDGTNIIEAERGDDDMMPKKRSTSELASNATAEATPPPPEVTPPAAESVPIDAPEAREKPAPREDMPPEAAAEETPAGSSASGQHEPEQADLLASAAQPEVPATISFMIGPKEYITKGVTKSQLLEIFKASEQVNKKTKSTPGGPELAATILKREFSVEHRTDLTADAAERYLIRLKECLA